jgi:hypothetical protein
MKANLILITMMLVSSSFALRQKPEHKCSNRFENSCENIKIDGRLLRATCMDNHGHPMDTFLFLSKCLKVNIQNELDINRKGNRDESEFDIENLNRDESFNISCVNCSLKSTKDKATAFIDVEITCTCKGKESSFMLSYIIGNSNGNLNCNKMCL